MPIGAGRLQISPAPSCPVRCQCSIMGSAPKAKATSGFEVSEIDNDNGASTDRSTDGKNKNRKDRS